MGNISRDSVPALPAAREGTPDRNAAKIVFNDLHCPPTLSGNQSHEGRNPLDQYVRLVNFGQPCNRTVRPEVLAAVGQALLPSGDGLARHAQLPRYFRFKQTARKQPLASGVSPMPRNPACASSSHLEMNTREVTGLTVMALTVIYGSQ